MTEHFKNCTHTHTHTRKHIETNVHTYMCVLLYESVSCNIEVVLFIINLETFVTHWDTATSSRVHWGHCAAGQFLKKARASNIMSRRNMSTLEVAPAGEPKLFRIAPWFDVEAAAVRRRRCLWCLRVSHSEFRLDCCHLSTGGDHPPWPFPSFPVSCPH